MKVVLLEEVAGIGGPGTVKDVKNGYARNYLLPRNLATPATPGALKQVEQQRQAVERRQLKIEAEAAALAARIDGQVLVFRVRAGDAGRLYGSVTNGDVAEVLERNTGVAVDRRLIQLPAAINTLGTYEVPVRLGAGHTPTLKVIVQPE